MKLRREAAIIHRMQNRNTSFQNSSCTLCVPMFLISQSRVCERCEGRAASGEAARNEGASPRENERLHWFLTENEPLLDI